jgi:hypothetical protein
MPRLALIAATVLATALLSACDLFGDSAEKLAAARDADGRAIGGACRHANRAIEDCYTLNRKADRAAVFAGWRDMNDYMRENKIEAVPSATSPAARATKGDKAEKTEKATGKDKAEAHAEEPATTAQATESTDAAPIERKPAKATPKGKDAEH